MYKIYCNNSCIDNLLNRLLQSFSAPQFDILSLNTKYWPLACLMRRNR